MAFTSYTREIIIPLKGKNTSFLDERLSLLPEIHCKEVDRALFVNLYKRIHKEQKLHEIHPHFH